MDDEATAGRAPAHTISRPEQLLAELPALLHFVPAAPSLVVFGQSEQHGPGTTPIVRIDLPPPVVMSEYLTAVLGPVDGDLERYVEDSELAPVGDEARTAMWALLMDIARVEMEFARHITELCSSQHLSQAVVVALVEDSCDAQSPVWMSVDILASKLRGWMERGGTDLTAVLVCEQIADGAPWRYAEVDDDQLERQLDPRTSELAARQVMSGRRIHADRDEIVALYAEQAGPRIVPQPLVGAPADTESGATYVATLVGLSRPAGGQPSPLDDDRALQHTADLIADATVFEHVLRAITRAAVVAADQDRGDAASDRGGAPEDWFGSDGRDLDLLAAVARRGDPRCRGAALLLTAVVQYLGGNGVHTVECLEQAKNCTFMPTFGMLLLGLIQRGESPHRVREILQELLDADLPRSA